MRLFIEGYNYKPEDVEGLGLDVLRQRTNEGVNFKYVGYYYDPKLEDCVFFLPKVIINEKGKAFDTIEPKDLINLFSPKNGGEQNYAFDIKDLTPIKDFLCNLSVWIYRAVKKYVVTSGSGINDQHIYSNVAINSNTQNYTLLDIILSLIKFNNENRDFFMFVVKNQHSGLNKINWNKTISRTTAYIENDEPMYLSPINKSKQVNFDEELLVIFYSILNYIGTTYGFKTPINLNYKLIQYGQFQRYLRSYGKIRLRQIKYKYFSDKALVLWKLCYSFFEKVGEINSSKDRDDYLLVSNFNPVFEAMIDDLVSDKNKIVDNLKDQDDGKRVDHIFKYESLVNRNDIYYIGDSKYYKIGAEPENTAHYKQYTYAKNVIQEMVTLFISGKSVDGVPYRNYRDTVTEGYNITPNFFISGKMNKDRNFNVSDLRQTRDFDENKDRSVHYVNRLFDRDTLLLAHFDINFLYVLSMYTSNRFMEKRNFKEKIQAEFRNLIVKILNRYYTFFSSVFSTHDDLKSFVNLHFRLLLGKMFCPMENGSELILAFEKGNYVFNDETSIQCDGDKLTIAGCEFEEYLLR